MSTTISPDDLVTVARYSDPVEAQMAQGVLEAAEITSFISGEEGNSLLPSVSGARLQVRNIDLDTARQLLNATPMHEGAPLADDGNDL